LARCPYDTFNVSTEEREEKVETGANEMLYRWWILRFEASRWREARIQKYCVCNFEFVPHAPLRPRISNPPPDISFAPVLVDKVNSLGGVPPRGLG